MTLEEYFQDFLQHAYNRPIVGDQMKQVRAAFFGGALVALKESLTALKEDRLTESTESWLKEINAFENTLSVQKGSTNGR